MDADLTNMCFTINCNTFEIAKMDCVMKKNKKFIKFKDFTLRTGGGQGQDRDGFIYIVDDENEIHQYDVGKNSWAIVETSRENH